MTSLHSEKITEYYFKKLIEDKFPIHLLLVEQQITKNTELANALNYSSKNNAKNNGRPDFIITCQSHKIIFLVECKRDKQKHISKDYSKIIECACDGAIWYGKFASAVMQNYKVYSIGVSGPFPDPETDDNKDDKDYNLLIDSFLVRPDGTYSKLNSGLRSFDEYINCNLMDKQSKTKELISVIHNFMRDNFSMTEVQKPLSIALCLLGNLWRMGNIKEVIEKCKKELQLSMEEMKDSKFLLEDPKPEFNNLSAFNYIQNLIKSCSDDMQDFYMEFIRYSGGDGKNLGIVMTPTHVAELMVTLANIDSNSTVIDICAGTGSFLWQALNKGARFVYGIEFNNLMYTLLKINALIRGIGPEFMIHADALTVNFEGYFSQGILNPPYSQKGASELKFMNFILKSIQPKGKLVTIIPISCLTTNTDERNELIKKHNITGIITMPLQIFYPTAIATAIVIVEANTQYEGKTWLCNFSDDGFNLEKHVGRVEYKWKEKRRQLLNRFERKEIISDVSTLIELKADFSEWLFAAFNTSLQPVNLIEFKKAKITYEAFKKILELSSTISNTSGTSILNFKKYLIKDLFDIETPEKITIKFAESNPGKIPLISSTAYDNGVSCYCNYITYDSGEKLFISLATNGSVGSSFIQKGKVARTADVIFLIPKIQLTEKQLIYICEALKEASKNYSYTRKWVPSKVRESFILLPENMADIEIL